MKFLIALFIIFGMFICFAPSYAVAVDDVGGAAGGVVNPQPQALELKNIDNPIQKTFPIMTTNLGGVLSSVLRIVFLIVPFLLFIWLAWGIFQYIFAGGNKEGLKKAQARITYALIGFVIVILAYAISGFVQTLATPNREGAKQNIFVR